MDAFHAAYNRGELVPPPEAYLELILIPAVLHTPTATYRRYKPAERARIRTLLMHYLGAGQGLDTRMIRRHDGQ